MSQSEQDDQRSTVLTRPGRWSNAHRYEIWYVSTSLGAPLASALEM